MARVTDASSRRVVQRATEWNAPAATAVTSVRPLAWIGVLRVVRVLSPNCPLLFSPKVQTVPFVFRTTV